MTRRVLKMDFSKLEMLSRKRIQNSIENSKFPIKEAKRGGCVCSKTAMRNWSLGGLAVAGLLMLV